MAKPTAAETHELGAALVKAIERRHEWPIRLAPVPLLPCGRDALRLLPASEVMNALDLLLAREEKIRRDLSDPAVTEIDIPAAFYTEQVGLRRVMLDPIGRLWDVDARPAKMIFDPHADTRKTELDHG